MANSNNFEPSIYDIDKYRLPEEWEAQPKLFYKHAMILANRNADYERAKANEKLVYAEVEQEFRLEKSGDAKQPTEATVKAVILTDTRYKAAQEATITAGHDADVAKVAVDTVDRHRKAALESELSMFLAGVYAKPREKSNESEQLKLLSKKKVRNPES